MAKPKTPSKSEKEKALTRTGAIIAAIVGVTVILTFLIKLPQEISASIDVFRATETLTPSNTPEPSATFTPAPTNTDFPTATFTLEPTFTPQPTITATLVPSKTPTKIPTSTPTIPPAVFRGFDKNCISKTYWYPTPQFPSDNLTLDKNNCWNLTSWGIVSENQALKFIVSDDIFNDRVTRSIYTTIGSNIVIEFKIKVTSLTSASDMDGAVFIGLGNKTSYSEPGYFLKWVVPARETKPYFEYAPDYFQYYEPRIEYSFGDVQTIKIVINGSDVSIQINGVEKRLSLHPSKREVLWIGYSTPASNNYVNAVISDFRIYDK